MENYEKLDQIGEGTHGKVYMAEDKKTGQHVALKKIRIQEEKGIPPDTLREISLLKLLFHSFYIVRLVDVVLFEKKGNKFLYLVLEYMDCNLKRYIDFYMCGPNPEHLPPHVIRSFLYQLCKGVAHCHSHGVLHGSFLHTLVTGFGCGRAFTIPIISYPDKISTLRYRAPEVLLGSNKRSGGEDMWSVGCIFAEMATSQPLFPGDSQSEQLSHIFRLLGTPTEEQWPGVSSLCDWHAYPLWTAQNLADVVPSLDSKGIDLLSKMFQYNPAKRICAIEALEHPYFENLDKSQF